MAAGFDTLVLFADLPPWYLSQHRLATGAFPIGIAYLFSEVAIRPGAISVVECCFTLFVEVW